ncbi:MAG TPA: hypothetical protein VEA44_05030 [Caulobacter sp.]|nr:hypothetical protein [Caulobacter sp.]
MRAAVRVRAVRPQQAGDRADAGRRRPIEGVQQRELAVGQADRPQGLVEPPAERARGALGMQAQAAVPHIVGGLEGHGGAIGHGEGSYVDINLSGQVISPAAAAFLAGNRDIPLDLTADDVLLTFSCAARACTNSPLLRGTADRASRRAVRERSIGRRQS